MTLIRKKSRATQEEEFRAEHWPDVDPSEIWDRKVAKGFATIPRTLTLIMRIIDSMMKGKPGSTVYLELWCRANDFGVVRLHGLTEEIAFACGFGGNRKTHTWESRLKQLEKHGFIRFSNGAGNASGYALILNPYFVIYKLHEAGALDRAEWLALFERANLLKADDLSMAKRLYSTPPEEPKKPAKKSVTKMPKKQLLAKLKKANKRPKK